MAPGEHDSLKNSSLQPDCTYLLQLGSAMHILRQRNKLIDVVITCGKRNFPAHRLVLCTASSFFQNLLLNENPQNDINTIDMEDVSGDIVEMLLDYMYKGCMSPTALGNCDTLVKLLTASELLQINGAVMYVTSLALQLNPLMSVILIWDWAEDFENDQVEKAVMECLATNIEDVEKILNFGKIPQKRFSSFLSKPAVSRLNPQDPVLQALLYWVSYDPENRNALLESFLDEIQTLKLTENYLQHLLSEDQAAIDNEAFCTKLTEIKAKLRALQKSPSAERMSKSRSASDKMTAYPVSVRESIRSISDDADELSEVQGSSTWKLLSPRSIRNCNALFTFNEAVKTFTTPMLLLLGKDDANRPVVHLYIPEKSAWSMSCEIKCPCLEKMACSYYKGRLYLMGGEDERQRKQSSTYVFHLGTQTVREGPPLRLPRSNPGVTQYDELVYVVDGINRYGSYMTHVECFNMEDEMWKIIPPTKETHQHPGVEVIDGRLYVIGGFTTRCECFDPAWDSWQDIVSLPDLYKDCTVVTASYDNKIFAFRYFKPDRVCCLDPGKNEWRMMKTLGFPPDRISTICNVNEELWALDKQGHFFIFDILTNTWEQSFGTPKNLTVRIFITIAHLDNSCL